ncbi:M15 family metallopeptidase [Neolewinella litorea]|uniref:D-alanyl-D-alanine carboxypeptidase family protein n=1 Tax=Neolewinella litorea TaxID=2562452 RepID=A0A4S4NPL5_9BACT|nr:M15 family metallopeptidase [Neolewinella litorea]THH40351.1 D-alanyl-D-alanine carboxypeptidase family protein [Neolewinella litorea]
MKYLLLTLATISLLSCSPAQPASAAEPAPPATDVPDPAPATAPMESDSIGGIPIYTYLTGQFDPAKHPDFVKVADRYTDGDPYLLHRDTYDAFERMHAAARQHGVNLKIVSATRNFARQKQIWEAKWNGQRLLEGKEKADEVYPDPADRAKAILRYSSMPGTSRHHWGTDIDLNALNNEYFQTGEGKKVYDWLRAHGAEFGFCQPYTAKGAERPNGYEEERWHWSYLPLATRLTDYAATKLRDEDIGGFAGAEAAPRIGVVKNYVLGVNPECKE